MKTVKKISIAGAGFAFPGPFDYKNGISLMKEINKYDSIYGVSIETEIKKKLPILQKIPFKFLHDIEAFALGEYYFGLDAKPNRVFCLCIGTGTGSAFFLIGFSRIPSL